MRKQNNHPLFKKEVIYTLVFAVLFSAVFFTIDINLRTNENSLRKEAVLSHMKNIVQVEADSAYSQIDRVVSDALFLLDSYKLGIALGCSVDELEAQWLAFSARSGAYDQIRFLNADGDELIRVNFDGKSSSLTSEDNLQNKADRYYFADSIGLSENDIYFSQLDLNVENGITELPIKPMLRVCILYVDETDVTRGEIVLNYLANDVLEEIRSVSTAGETDIFLVNSSGGWILNTVNPDAEWSFLFPERAENSFSNQYPAAWDMILANNAGTIVTDLGVFAYSGVIVGDSADERGYSHVLAEGNYYIISYLSPESDEGKIFYDDFASLFFASAKKNWFLSFGVILLSLALALLVTFKQAQEKRIQFFSEFDTMTGILNRRAGLANLSAMHKAALSAGKSLCVCFLDINGLKSVNDILGHEAGDALIVSVSQSIQKCIRENDLFARLGGDEFLLVFWDADAARADQIWARIDALFDSINETQNLPYLISVSRGIVEIPVGNKESLDETISRADKAMYEYKREIKRGLRVVRGTAADAQPESKA